MADDDNRSAGGYDDPMSERLLGVAADVLRSFGSAFGGRHLAIVGGAVPSLLVPIPPAGIDTHVGTADLGYRRSDRGACAEPVVKSVPVFDSHHRGATAERDGEGVKKPDLAKHDRKGRLPAGNEADVGSPRD